MAGDSDWGIIERVSCRRGRNQRQQIPLQIIAGCTRGSGGEELLQAEHNRLRLQVKAGASMKCQRGGCSICCPKGTGHQAIHPLCRHKLETLGVRAMQL